MTNLTLQPIWPSRTSTIGSIFSGTFDASAATFMLVKILYESLPISLEAISIGLAILVLIPWFRTFFMMPKKTMPREVDSDYDLRKSTVIACCKKMSDKEVELQRMKEGIDNSMKNTNKSRVLKTFVKQIKTRQFVCLAIWYCLVSLRINSYQSWFNPSLEWMFPGDRKIQSELTNVFDRVKQNIYIYGCSI